MEIFLRMRKDLPEGGEPVSEYFFRLVPTLDVSVAESHLRKVLAWFDLVHQEFEQGELVNDEDDGLTIT